MSAQQDLQQEVDRLTAALAERDQEVASLRTRLTLDESGGRAPIVRGEPAAGEVDDAETFHEALRGLALVSRLRIGAHQAALSYVPDGDFKAAIHTHSFSEKYARYNAYDVMPTGDGIWGLVVKQRAPIRITTDELYAHPAFKEFSGLKNGQGLEHPPMPGWLAVPVLRRDGGLIGVVQLSDKFDGEFTEADEDQLVQLAKFYTATFELQYVYEDLRRLTGALRQATRELQRSNAELEQFAYVASHDLQEPLRMVTSYLQLLERRYKANLDQDASDFIAFAVDGAARMQTLIQDLLTYSRVGTRGASFEPTDSQAVLDQVLMNLEVAIAESDAEISFGSLPSLSADTSQMAQLLQNLIGNAIKFRGTALPASGSKRRAKATIGASRSRTTASALTPVTRTASSRCSSVCTGSGSTPAPASAWPSARKSWNDTRGISGSNHSRTPGRPFSSPYRFISIPFQNRTWPPRRAGRPVDGYATSVGASHNPTTQRRRRRR